MTYQLEELYNEQKARPASTYPVKLIENLRKEIEDLKKDRDDWKDMFRQAKEKHGYCIQRCNQLAKEIDRIRYPRDAIDI